MRRPIASLAAAVYVCVAALGADNPPPGFAKKPVLTRDGDKVTIAFESDRFCDVTVAVENASGRIVRHIVSGMLGPNPPEPLRKNSLAQVLVWDGKDDLGQPAQGGPFKARVALGLKPTFGGFIGFRPEAIGGARVLATGHDGRVYVFHSYGASHTHDDATACAVFTRDGKYLKTISPYPADLPDDRLRGLRRIDLGNGVKVPFIYQFETRSLIPGLGDLPRQRGVVTRDGRLAFVGIQEGPHPFAQAGEARLTVIGTDGSAPAAVLRTLIHPLTDTGASLALSPDEKTLYATGVRACTHAAVKPGVPEVCYSCVHQGTTWNHTVPTRAVYRFTWDEAQVTEFGRNVSFKEPVGLATDKDGNVYVADLAADCIVVLKPDGHFIRSLKASRPQRVEVHKTTGAIYVLSGERNVDLLKMPPDGTETARLRLPIGSDLPIRRPIMALDDSAEPPVLWFNGPLLRVEDRGRSFSDPVRVIPDAPKDEPGSIGAVMDLTIDRSRGRLYVNNYWCYTTSTAKWEKITTPGRQMWPGSSPVVANAAMGLDGNYYVHPGGGAHVYRLGPDMKPRPFPASTDKEGRLRGFALDFGYGHTADAAGNVYVLWKKCPADPGDLDRAHALYVYGPDGELKKAKLVDSELPYIRSVRVDYAGNIYLASGIRPGTSTLPPGLRGRLPEGREDRDAVNGINCYPLIYGSIVKFGPEGGAIRKGSGGVPCNFSYGSATEVKGAKWIFPGASVVVSWGAGGTVPACRCELTGLDVDGFGRSFFCDAGRFRIGVLDTAGNEVCWIGSYGNQDSAGPGSAIPTPEIAFAWPQAVAVDDTAAYIGDRLNRRIVRVVLDYAAVETAAVP